MKCNKCGASNNENSVFCSNCGTRLINDYQDSVHLITANCPKYGAVLTIENNRLEAFCSYCGTKLLIHRDNEKIYHFIDEADIKRAETEEKNAETDRIIKLRHLEEAKKEKKKEQIRNIIAFAVCLLILMLGEVIENVTGASMLTACMLIIGLFGAIFSGFLLLGFDKKKNE